MPREKGRTNVAQNRKARHDYHLHDTFEAGLVLMGTEVKSLRAGRASLTEAFATVDDGEVWLRNAHIPEYSQGKDNHLPRRNRKLLLHRREIQKLERETDQSGRTIVALAIYFSDGYAKVEIAIATGKRDWDKRQTLIEREANREAERAMSSHIRQRRHA
jgi:SsrA-binding protein